MKDLMLIIQFLTSPSLCMKSYLTAIKAIENLEDFLLSSFIIRRNFLILHYFESKKWTNEFYEMENSPLDVGTCNHVPAAAKDERRPEKYSIFFP